MTSASSTRRQKRAAELKIEPSISPETSAAKKTRASRAVGSPPEAAPSVVKTESNGELIEEAKAVVVGVGESRSPKEKATPSPNKSKENGHVDSVPDWRFLGEPIPEAEARAMWPERYQKKDASKRGSGSANFKKGNDEEVLQARCHYQQAEVENCIYNLNDDAYVKAGEGEVDYIGRIIEFFETIDGQLYFTAQWFFRAEDTVIKEHAHAHSHDDKRVFLSEEKNENALDCIVSKIRIVRVSPDVKLEAKMESIPSCDLYYDMSYSLAYSTFSNLPSEKTRAGSESETSSVISSEDATDVSIPKSRSGSEASSSDQKNVMSLLDLYSGCGAMSTGLCLGANLSGVNLETRWAVDFNRYACESLKLNHPRTEVRNEKAEDFLALLREWEKLCRRFSLLGTENSRCNGAELNNFEDEEQEDLIKVPPGEFEVAKLIGICFGDPSKIGKNGLKFKVRWRGYGPSEDTWEPIEGLSKCEERIEDFVRRGYRFGILPLPGDVDVICGGPPCQGISGFNRFRNFEAPLEDPKNQQMVVFMDIVEYLKPKFVLMENVVDILKFAQGFLGRYALSKLVSMNYQARLGVMAAGCYGLPQFRLRVFLWGARPTEKLPQFPLPTHDVVVRGGTPNEFEQNIVAYDENQCRELEEALLLADAISDLPAVANNETRDEMPYGGPPRTEFQRYIRLTKHEMMHWSSSVEKSIQKAKLFDHRPLQLNEDDYLRVCEIPKKKGANFRDLPGVIVGPNNTVEWDPNIERVLLPSGKPLVPDYAMSFIKGRSSKPFGRLWWDETVPTVVTRAEPHNQVGLHPEQDRVLSVRENARLQGFPDYYKLCGLIKERYIQVGNAVAVPVARALGYALGLAFRGVVNDHPLLTLPRKFPCLDPALPVTTDVTTEGDDVVE